VCPDPNALVRAANVRATLDAFNLIPTVGRTILEHHGLRVDDLRTNHFVSVQRWLDVLRDVQTAVGTNLVRQVGTRIIENADFPERFRTTAEVIEALDEIYYLNHRGNVGHYRVRPSSDGFVVRCETPYPRSFERGLIEGITQNRRLRDREYRVDFEDGPEGSDVTCVLFVRRV